MNLLGGISRELFHADPTYTSHGPHLSSFRRVFVNTSHLIGLPAGHELQELYLNQRAGDEARFDNHGLNTDFLKNLYQLQYVRPSVFIEGGLTPIAEQYKDVEVYNTGPRPLNPKEDITIVPPLWRMYMTQGREFGPISPLWTVHHGRFQREIQNLIGAVLSMMELDEAVRADIPTNEDYLNELMTQFDKALAHNSLWRSMMQCVQEHNGCEDNGRNLRILRAHFKECWYPVLVESELGNENNQLLASYAQALNPSGEDNALVDAVNNGVSNETVEKAWDAYRKKYKMLSSLSTRLKEFVAPRHAAIICSSTESLVIPPGGK